MGYIDNPIIDRNYEQPYTPRDKNRMKKIMRNLENSKQKKTDRKIEKYHFIFSPYFSYTIKAEQENREANTVLYKLFFDIKI